MRGELKETVVISTPEGMEKTKKEADLKTRIAAAKELMKRYSIEDPVIKQQLRKLTADAELSEIKAQRIKEDGNAGITQIEFTDDMVPDKDDENEV